MNNYKITYQYAEGKKVKQRLPGNEVAEIFFKAFAGDAEVVRGIFKFPLPIDFPKLRETLQKKAARAFYNCIQRGNPERERMDPKATPNCNVLVATDKLAGF